jgi:hypothetical protein
LVTALTQLAASWPSSTMNPYGRVAASLRPTTVASPHRATILGLGRVHDPRA